MDNKTEQQKTALKEKRGLIILLVIVAAIITFNIIKYFK